MASKTILIAEDDADLQEVLRLTFEAEGFRVFVAADGEQAMKYVRRYAPDLLVLDVMMPKKDGIEVCQEIRRDGALEHLPILMLTARSEESDVVLGLGVGADDYVTKPARPRELVARVRNILRRSADKKGVESGVMISVEGFVIDPTRFEVRCDDMAEPIVLTPAEFKLLQTLAGNPGRVYRRGDLLDKVVGPGAIVTERNIDTHVKSVRKKLGEHGFRIETVRGVGYRFSDRAE
ncbi:MAG: response regulator transcription factor [Planctomycetes bacterium]|jgi:two-component system phosphate regulon response regulator PhoB|nr:response regulator transcription factor [Planctomycetota bacterium]